MVRWGILGAGNIAHRFCASLAHEGRSELVAVSCRSEEKAATFLSEVGAAPGVRAYGGHERLLEDADVDAIYLALPHAHHREWAMRAIDWDKAVLSEKPAMLTAGEMREVAEASREHGVLFMEAMKPRFQPIYPKICEQVKRIGRIKAIGASLCNDMLEEVEGAPTYHMTPGAGAGVLLDCGIYCANWLANLTDPTAPIEAGHVECVLVDGNVDVYVRAELEVAGVAAELECAFDRAKPRTCRIVGECGVIEIDELHRPQRAKVMVEGEEPHEIVVPYVVDDFFGEISHFVDLLEAGALASPVMGLEDSVRVAEFLDTVRATMLRQ